MELTTQTITWLIAILLTGLSAGLFFAWEVSVIPGTKSVSDQNYVETMQAINRAIINPKFMLIFLGSFLVQILTTYQHRGSGAFWVLLAATLMYFFGTLLVTGMGNVPLNDALDVLDMKELSAAQIMEKRSNYERRWNKLHTIRTVFAVMSFLLLLLPVFFQSK